MFEGHNTLLFILRVRQAESCEITALVVVRKEQQFTTLNGLVSTIFKSSLKGLFFILLFFY